jgi:hypothetical protein
MSGSTWPPRISRTTLVRSLGMLGSQFDGEVLNAARLADGMVRGAGGAWTDVIGLPPDPQTHPDDCDWLFSDWPLRWRWIACACLETGADLRDFDRKFLRNVVAWGSAPSSAQLRVLRDIANRLLAMAPA